jgi:hypothetical protein
MPAPQRVDRESAAEQLRPVEARRGCEQEPTEESVEVAHGDAEVRDLDAGGQGDDGRDLGGPPSV